MNRDLHILLANLWLIATCLANGVFDSITSLLISIFLFITIPERSKR